MGGVAGIRAMVFFSPTDYGEIIIFGLSKDPATRNWSTLMNTEQFLILVTYLLLYISTYICVFSVWKWMFVPRKYKILMFFAPKNGVLLK
jgi:hypothetical protein